MTGVAGPNHCGRPVAGRERAGRRATLGCRINQRLPCLTVPGRQAVWRPGARDETGQGKRDKATVGVKRHNVGCAGSVVGERR